MEIRAPLFKGATRPACIWGIPLLPFLGCIGVYMLIAFWTWIPLSLLALPTLFVMHRITKEDDQRFRQLFLYFKTNILGTGNKHYWRGINSFACTSYHHEPPLK